MTASWKTFCHDRRGCWIAELGIEAPDAGALWAAVELLALGSESHRRWAGRRPSRNWRVCRAAWFPKVNRKPGRGPDPLPRGEKEMLTNTATRMELAALRRAPQ
jgi:hypothetical protein